MKSSLKAILRRPNMQAVLGQTASRGFTLVELLVAMAVSLLVILAATAALLAGRRGAETVDVAGQLRDNGRFASELVQRLVVQTGFEDLHIAGQPYASNLQSYRTSNQRNAGAGSGIEITELTPNLQGFNNAVPSPTDPINNSNSHAANSAAAGSDVLILQYQQVRNNLAEDPGSAVSDGSMIDCAGNAPIETIGSREDRILSVLYVATDAQGEPSLMCMTKNNQTGAISTTPLVRGVESFQVLYGVDNVEPETAPSGDVGSVSNRYLRADQLTVAGNQNATNTNWRRVRSLRIGMVLRGAANSGQEAVNQTLYPLGSADYSSTDDPGSQFAVNDNRLRQVVTFTVLLRNCQNQGYQPDPSDPDNPIACNVVLPS